MQTDNAAGQPGVPGGYFFVSSIGSTFSGVA